jgi:hypothetical protein
MRLVKGVVRAALALTAVCSTLATAQEKETDAAASAAAASRCDEDLAPCPWGTSRIINGHRFIFPAFVEHSFVSTYLDVRSGARVRQVHDLPIGRLGRLDLEQIEVAETIDGELRLFDGVGLFGTFAATATAATNATGLIFLPVQYSFVGDGGVIVQVLRLEEAGTQVSLRARVGVEGGRRFTLAPLLNATADAPARTAESIAAGNLGNLLVTPFSSFRWGGSVAAAQPLSEVFSLQASAGIAFEEMTLRPFEVVSDARQDQEFSVFVPSAGLAAAADARPLGVPLALMLEYQLSARRTEDEQTDTDRTQTLNVLAAGLYYSGRTDLQAGLLGFVFLNLEPITGTDASGNPAESDTPVLFGGQLVLRYVW